MARFIALSLVIIVVLICCAPSLEARKVLSMEKKILPSLEDSSTFSPSAPSGKDLTMFIYGKLFAFPEIGRAHV